MRAALIDYLVETAFFKNIQGGEKDEKSQENIDRSHRTCLSLGRNEAGSAFAAAQVSGFDPRSSLNCAH